MSPSVGGTAPPLLAQVRPPKALSTHFGYHTKTIYRNYTPNHKVLAAIKQELDQNNPMLMVGSQESSGHAWGVDGYDENGHLHVNWG